MSDPPLLTSMCMQVSSVREFFVNIMGQQLLTVVTPNQPGHLQNFLAFVWSLQSFLAFVWSRARKRLSGRNGQTLFHKDCRKEGFLAGNGWLVVDCLPGALLRCIWMVWSLVTLCYSPLLIKDCVHSVSIAMRSWRCKPEKGMLWWSLVVPCPKKTGTASADLAAPTNGG